jgi:hypothetical protein
MKDKIPVILNDNHMYSCAINVIAYNNENDVSQLEITLDDRLLDYWVFIDFEKPDGTKIKTPKLNTVGNVATYVIPRSLVDQDGSLKAQIVLQNEEDVVWKSSIKTYRVKSSINATDDIPEEEREDFITEAQKLLEEIKQNGGGTITDVLVDGISVVDNKIANIQLKQAVINILIEYGLIQNGEPNENQVADIEQLIVSYFENKTIEEVER